mgnify:FL=1
MSSIAERNQFKAILVTEPIWKSLRQIYQQRDNNKTVLEMCDRMKGICDELLMLYSGRFSAREIAGLKRFVMEDFGPALVGTEAPPAVPYYTSMAMGAIEIVIEQLEKRSKNQRKIDLLCSWFNAVLA